MLPKPTATIGWVSNDPKGSSGRLFGRSRSWPPVTVLLVAAKAEVRAVLAEASGLVVYTYKKDTKGGDAPGMATTVARRPVARAQGEAARELTRELA